MKMNKNTISRLGFTLIEMTIVLIMIGILTASMLPLLLRQHSNTMEERDRTALEEAKTAIINYASTFGGIPDPVTIGGITNAMSAVPAFGVNNWGAFGDGTSNPFRLDVNDQLKSSIVGLDRVAFCQAVNAQMKAAAINPPSICQDYNDRTAAGVTTACTTPIPAAFVLYSTGNDHTANQGNALNNRIYENDKRGINNNPGDSHYDDQVMSYPMTALVRDCREKMGVDPNAMNCPAGYKFVGTVTNNYPAATATNGGTFGFNTATPSSSVPANPNAAWPVNLCRLQGDTLYVNPNSLIAASAVPVGTLSTLDANKDGRVDIFIDVTGNVTAQ